MKKIQFFMGALLMGAMMFTACEKKNEVTPIVPPADTTEVVELEEAPQLAAPGAGKVTIAIRAIDACNGLYLAGVKGAYPGTTEGTMTKVEGTETWYQITGELADFLSYGLKALLVPAAGEALTYNYEWVGDGNVEILSGEAELKDDYGTANALNVKQEADNSVIYVTAAAFKASPCVKDEPYTISVKVPEMCAAAGTQVYLIGGFATSNWSTDLPMELKDGVWVATVEAQPNTEFKVRGSEGTWDIELKRYDEEAAEWKGIDNLKLTEDKAPLFDLSAYSWSVCIE